MESLRSVVGWYFREIYGRYEGPGTLPFYCDRSRLGAFAVSPEALASGRAPALFRLFVTLSMYQALRDVVIMRKQRVLPRSSVRALLDVRHLAKAAATHRCPSLRSHEALQRDCDVFKRGEAVDCLCWSGQPCPVKEATVAFDRMGDMGKLPTSAWLLCWKDGLQRLLDEATRRETSPNRRAEWMVERFAEVHRVGRKLATMFVSALATPALAPGFTPWFPRLDGNELVVVDTNVARACDLLRKRAAPKTYEARAQWVCRQAEQIDLKEFCATVPSYSPRLVQQALFAFGSKSNRSARQDGCASSESNCLACAPALCPFSTKSDAVRASALGARALLRRLPGPRP